MATRKLEEQHRGNEEEGDNGVQTVGDGQRLDIAHRRIEAEQDEDARKQSFDHHGKCPPG